MGHTAVFLVTLVIVGADYLMRAPESLAETDKRAHLRVELREALSDILHESEPELLDEEFLLALRFRGLCAACGPSSTSPFRNNWEAQILDTENRVVGNSSSFYLCGSTSRFEALGRAWLEALHGTPSESGPDDSRSG